MKARSDDDVCRELQELLAVDPSPNFVARVRTAVANQPSRWGAPAFFVAAATGVTAVLLIASAVYRSNPATHEIAASTVGRYEQTPPAPIPEARVDTPTTPPSSEMVVRRVNHVKARRVAPEPSLQVLVAPEDVQAFERLVQSTTDGTVALSFDETNRKLTMTELTITPIPIEPLVLSEQQGVVQ